MSDNSSTTITSQYLFQDIYHYNTNAQRPTFSWKANAKDTRENTNERTDQGSGIDRYTLTIQKDLKYPDSDQYPQLVVPNWETVFEIPEIIFYPFTGETSKDKWPYYKVETDTYTLEYLNFDDDQLKEDFPDTYTQSYDNNIIYLTTKDCISPDPYTGQPKECWGQGEDEGRLVASSANLGSKYKWIVKAWDKAGNTTEGTRIIYYKPQSYYGGSEVLAAEDNQEDNQQWDEPKQEEQTNQVVNQPQTKNQSTGSGLNPSTFIVLGLLFLSLPLILWAFLIKKSKKQVK